MSEAKKYVPVDDFSKFKLKMLTRLDRKNLYLCRRKRTLIEQEETELQSISPCFSPNCEQKMLNLKIIPRSTNTMIYDNSTLIDNSSTVLSMTRALNECISRGGIKEIRIATGYWDMKGMECVFDALKTFLDSEGTTLKLLIGKDPYVYANQLKNPVFKDFKYPNDYVKRHISELQFIEEDERLVRLLLDYCDGDDAKFRIKLYNKNAEDESQFLHSKCYIFSGKSESRWAVGIIGSSNFTKQGLEGNAELNYLQNQIQFVDFHDDEGAHKGHVQWFEEKWAMAENWNKEFLEQILRKSEIVQHIEKKKEKSQDQPKDLTPYEVYIKYLQEQLGDIADPKSSQVLKSYLPSDYSTLSYQMDAVQQCFYIMRQHGGFILGDVVGLGKTVVGLLIIKKFLAEAATLNRDRKVLIVTPPAIKKAWENTIADFDEDALDKVGGCVRFITTGSIGKLVDEAGETEEEGDGDEFDGELGYDNYGLVIIDESHNFRNNQTQKYQDLDTLIGDIQLRTGNAPFVGLLSATPQNNSPLDLKNQIYLFQREPNKSTLPNIPGGKLDSFMTRMVRDFDLARKDSSPEGKRLLQFVASEVRSKVLNDLVVRRTRTDIKVHYADDSANLKFPTVKGPYKLEYRLDSELCNLFSDTISAIVKEDYMPFDPEKNLGFYRYTAISYFKSPEHKRLYEGRNISADRVSKQLSNIMRILLVKRLESSFAAFKTSLHNLQQYTQNMIDMLENDTVYICPDVDVNHVIEKAGSLKKAIPVLDSHIARKGKNNLMFHASDFQDEYLENLRQDLKLITRLCKRWDKNDYDPKMDSFKANLGKMFSETINNPHGYDKPRLVIFTEAIDTLDSLVRYINASGHKALRISAENRDEMHDAIVENFDANSKVKKDDFDVLVTTEVLAEGVNLHRANVILNYDTPWNATRLMQRIGRVNRIGSKEEFVHVFNFYPTMESNEQIRLVEIAYAKLQAFHTMFGEDNKVFSEMEELSEADFNKLVEDEESPFGKYIADLKAFQKEHAERYAYIASLPLETLGGVLKNDVDGPVVAVVVAQNRGMTNILYTPEVTNVISPLECMAELKCEPDAEYSSDFTTINADKKKAIIMCYQQHVTQMSSSKDAKKICIDASNYLHKIRKDVTSKSALDCWDSANKALRNNNITVAKRILKYKEERELNGISLFGADMDINLWLESAFSSIAEKAAAKYGEPVIALCEEK